MKKRTFKMRGDILSAGMYYIGDPTQLLNRKRWFMLSEKMLDLLKGRSDHDNGPFVFPFEDKNVAMFTNFTNATVVIGTRRTNVTLNHSNYLSIIPTHADATLRRGLGRSLYGIVVQIPQDFTVTMETGRISFGDDIDMAVEFQG